MSENVLTTPDLIVFFGSLAAVLAIGLWASRREETSEDFFLAGRDTPWFREQGIGKAAPLPPSLNRSTAPFTLPTAILTFLQLDGLQNVY